MYKNHVISDTFSGQAADLKQGQRTKECVLAVLANHPRVSTLDMDEHAWLRRCIDELKRDNLIANIESEPYPWLKYELTVSGKENILHYKNLLP